MTAIESALRLDIAQYQAALTKARAEAARFKEDLRNQRAEEALLSGPQSWHIQRSMGGFRAAMAGEGEAAGAGMQAALGRGLMSKAGLVGIALGVGSVLKQSLEEANLAESLTMRMKVLVGDAAQAKQLTTELRSLGANTPLEFPDLAEAGQLLIAFGESAADVPKTLERIGDIATGIGAPLRDIAEIYGKARVQNTLFAEDINQLTGRGIPVIQEFARILGEPESAVKKLASEGKITFPMLEAAFRNLTREGGKFHGMMESQSKTATGMWSNMKDALTALKTELGEPINAVEKWGLDKVIPALAKITRTMRVMKGDSSVFAEERAIKEAEANKTKIVEEEAQKREAAEARIRADAAAAKQTDAAKKQREIDAKAAAAREKTVKENSTLRASAEDLSTSMLPDEEKLATLQRRLRQVIFSAQLATNSSFPATPENLRNKALEFNQKGNVGAENVMLKALQQSLDIEREMASIRKSSLAAVERLRIAAAQTLDLQLNEAERLEMAKAALSEINAKIEQARAANRNTVELETTREGILQTILGLTKAIAAEERAAADSAAKQKAAMNDYLAELAINREIAAHHQRKAELMRQELEISRLQKQIQTETGASEAESLRIARMTVDLKKQIANDHQGSSGAGGQAERRRTQGYEPVGPEQARKDTADRLRKSQVEAQQRIDDQRRRHQETIDRDFTHAPNRNEGPQQSLRDTFQFPSLDQYKRNQPGASIVGDKAKHNAAKQDAASGKGANAAMESLLSQAIGILKKGLLE